MRGIEFGFHAPGGGAARNEPLAVGDLKMANHLAAAVADAVDVGEEKQAVGAEAHRAGHCHLVGIHVVDPPLAVPGYARHHRQETSQGNTPAWQTG